MLAFTTRHNVPVDEVTLAYNRCHKFYTEDVSIFGNPTDWLHGAAQAGFPIAQAEMAGRIFMQRMGAAPVTTGGSSLNKDWTPPIEEDMDPRHLLAAAVVGDDPNVFLQMAGMLKLLQPTRSRGELDLDNAAWIFLACNRGADCSRLGDLVALGCAPTAQRCPVMPSTLLNRLGNDWTPVAQRAEEISQALEAHDFDKIGLGRSD